MYILLGIFVFVLIFVLIMYNTLIGYRNSADSAYSTIDVMLKKRHDLIPNLVATVKGYMQHEASLLERLTELRASAMNNSIDHTQRLATEGQISSALGEFRMAVEAYPDLKANENFLRLQGALNECEEQLAAARRAFNAAVLQYNNSVEMFPNSMVANMFAFKRRAFFEISESDRANPNVKEALA